VKRIQVAVGLLIDEHGRVLVNQRTVKDQYFAKWEFPGGKLEIDESANVALKRELSEELGIEVLDSEQVLYLEFDYPDRQVSLYIQKVIEYLGVPYGREQQTIRWVEISELDQLDLLDGNKSIVEFLKSELVSQN
jgi:8-oxo-dGTP diphosphatase